MEETDAKVSAFNNTPLIVIVAVLATFTVAPDLLGKLSRVPLWLCCIAVQSVLVVPTMVIDVIGFVPRALDWVVSGLFGARSWPAAPFRMVTSFLGALEAPFLNAFDWIEARKPFNGVTTQKLLEASAVFKPRPGKEIEYGDGTVTMWVDDRKWECYVSFHDAGFYSAIIKNGPDPIAQIMAGEDDRVSVYDESKDRAGGDFIDELTFLVDKYFPYW
ncbi:hypothetical protein DICA3_E28282 [Diutina catenulata]